VSPSKAGKDVSMRRWGQIGPAEVMPALSHGWWKGWRGPKPLAADFRDRGRGFTSYRLFGNRHLRKRRAQAASVLETTPGGAPSAAKGQRPSVRRATAGNATSTPARRTILGPRATPLIFLAAEAYPAPR